MLRSDIAWETNEKRGPFKITFYKLYTTERGKGKRKYKALKKEIVRKKIKREKYLDRLKISYILKHNKSKKRAKNKCWE